MAIYFASSGNEYLILNSGLSIAQPYCASIWYYPNSSATAMCPLAFEGSSNNTYNEFVIPGTTANVRAQATPSIWALSAGGNSNSAWHHMVMEFASTTSRSIWIDGAHKGTNTTSATAVTPVRVVLGSTTNVTSGARPFDGAVALLTIWSGTITDAEVALLAKGIHPLKLRPLNVIEHFELTRRYIGVKGNAFTVGNGSPSVIPGPSNIKGYGSNRPYFYQVPIISAPADLDHATNLIGIPTVELFGQITTDDLEQEQTLEVPEVIGDGTIIHDLAHSHTLESPEVLGDGTAVNALTNLQSLGQPSVTYHGTTPNALTNAQTLSAPFTGIDQDVEVDDSSHATQTLGIPTVIRDGTTVADLTNAQSLDQPELSGDGTIVIDLTNLQSISQPVVAGAGTVVADLLNGNALSVPTLEITGDVACHPLVNAQVLDSPDVEYHGTIPHAATNAQSMSIPVVVAVFDGFHHWAGWTGPRHIVKPDDRAEMTDGTFRPWAGVRVPKMGKMLYTDGISQIQTLLESIVAGDGTPSHNMVNDQLITEPILAGDGTIVAALVHDHILESPELEIEA